MAGADTWEMLEQLRPDVRVTVGIKIFEGRLDVYVSSSERGSTRSTLHWSRGVVRPAGKTLEECVEAALYRVSAAAASGELFSPSEAG